MKYPVEREKSMSPNPTILYDLIDYQSSFMQARQKISALIGGTGCGKTFLLPIAIFYKAVEYSNETGRMMEVIVLAPTHKMLLRNPLKYIKHTLFISDCKYRLYRQYNNNLKNY